MSHFANAYADPGRAASYAALEFPATYSLAFRDLPGLLEEHVTGTRALDFGCGAGRSTRFLRELGFRVTGVDISAAMLDRAREFERGGAGYGRPEDGEARPGAGRLTGSGDGGYVLIGDDPADLPSGPFDLVLAAFPFDNIPGEAHRVALLAGLRERLAPAGRLVLVASSPELYVHEWATFTTAAFPENAEAGSGDVVRIVITAGGDPRPIEDLRWFDDDYRAAFAAAGLAVRAVHRPLATGEEPVEWVSETRVPPWVIYIAGPEATG